jgi:hypothetical protein
MVGSYICNQLVAASLLLYCMSSYTLQGFGVRSDHHVSQVAVALSGFHQKLHVWHTCHNAYITTHYSGMFLPQTQGLWLKACCAAGICICSAWQYGLFDSCINSKLLRSCLHGLAAKLVTMMSWQGASGHGSCFSQGGR